MGKDEEWLIEQSKRAGAPIPERILNSPTLFPGLELHLMAFMELTSCRGVGGGAIGPVPWLAIQRYCEVHSIEGDQREDLFYHVQRLDKVYMDWQVEKAKADAKANTGKGRGKR